MFWKRQKKWLTYSSTNNSSRNACIAPCSIPCGLEHLSTSPWNAHIASSFFRTCICRQCPMVHLNTHQTSRPLSRWGFARDREPHGHNQSFSVNSGLGCRNCGLHGTNHDQIDTTLREHTQQIRVHHPRTAKNTRQNHKNKLIKKFT